jgi:hypothetical protein
MNEYDLCKREAERYRIIYSIYTKKKTEEYIEYYREARKSLADEDAALIVNWGDKNIYDPAYCEVEVRHSLWMNEFEDEEETVKIVHKMMMDALFD